MEFSDAEREKLARAGLVLFRGKLILAAQPPIFDAQVAAVEEQIGTAIPPGLLELWRVAFGGTLDYDLAVTFGEHVYAASFGELFYPGSKGYRDLGGWIEHERELMEEIGEPVGTENGGLPFLPYLPFGGFEYAERMYCITTPGPEYGHAIFYAEGLPPAWKMRLNQEAVTTVSESVAGLFDQLSLDDDPWGPEENEYRRGLDMKNVIDSLGEEAPALAEKLRELVRGSVFDWSAIVESNDLAELATPELRRAARKAFHSAIEADDVVAIDRLIAKGCPLDVKIQAEATPLPIALGAGKFEVASRLLDVGLPLGDDPVIYAEQVPAEIVERLIERKVPFDVTAPRSVAEGGDVDLALRIVLLGQRADARAWRELGPMLTQATKRARKSIEQLRSGKLKSYLTQTQYAERAERLDELAGRLPRRKFFGLF